MDKAWAENEYFYWVGRGVGKVISVEQDSYEVIFSNEPQKTVKKDLFEKNARKVDIEGFYVIEGFFSDRLKTAIGSVGPEIVDWIAKDQQMLGRHSISNELISKLLKGHIGSDSDWKAWRKKFATVLKKHSRLGKPQGKGQNISYPFIEKRSAELAKEPDPEKTFEDNIRTFNEVKNFVIKDSGLQGKWQVYLHNMAEAENIYSNVKSALMLESLSQDFNFGKIVEASLPKLKTPENWVPMRRLAIKEQEKLIGKVSSSGSNEVPDILAVASISPSLYKKSRSYALKELFSISRKGWPEKIRYAVGLIKDDMKQKSLSPIIELLGVLEKEGKKRASVDDILLILGVLIKKKFDKKEGSERILQFFRKNRELIEREETDAFGKLKILQDLVDFSDDIEGSKRFFKEVVLGQDDALEKRLRTSAMVYLLANFIDVKKETEIPLNQEVCCSFLEIYSLEKAESLRQKKLEAALSQIQLKQERLDKSAFTADEIEAELGEDIAQAANKILDVSSIENHEMSEWDGHLDFVLSHPRAYMAIGYIISQFLIKLEKLMTEFREYKKRVNSPEFIRDLGEAEIERALQIRRENLEKSISLVKEKFEYEIMNKMADIVTSIQSFMTEIGDICERQNVQDYAGLLKNYRNDFNNKLSNLNLRILGEIGERLKFNPAYHDAIEKGRLGAEFEVVLPGCIWENPYKEKSIVLRKAIVRPC